MKNNKDKAFKIVLTTILWIGGILMTVPVIWMISSSFKFEADVFKMPLDWIPNYWNPRNYITAITDFPYFKWFFNTVKTTGLIVFLVIFVSSISGYAFAKLKFKGRDFIFFLFISTLMIPMQVRIIPQFMMFKVFGMINTHSSIVLPWMYNGFAIFLMRQFFMSVPDELIEAARIDGSNEYLTFFKVVMPLAKASFITLVVLSFTWGWNAYFGPLIYINDTNKQVLAVGIANFKAEYSDNFAAQMAGSTLALVPVITVYLLAQKHFIEGIAMSGIKG